MTATQLITSPGAVRAWSQHVRGEHRTLALVPTMGALHDGHRSLIELASGRADHVVVSIFVNPLQFDRGADFDAYPRPIDDDVETCELLDVDVIYAPTAATMYPSGFDTAVQPGALAAPMEGAMRPGHFAGVATVVTKLFGAVRPDVAVFGEKDFQQLTIITRMTLDLDLGVEIVAAPTVREADGLAISSRNARLTPEQRAAAVCVPDALGAVRMAYAAGERRPALLEAAAAEVVGTTERATLEYVTVFDPDTLAPSVTAHDGSRVAIAVWFGDVRLIDNVGVAQRARSASATLAR